MLAKKANTPLWIRLSVVALSVRVPRVITKASLGLLVEKMQVILTKKQERKHLTKTMMSPSYKTFVTGTPGKS
jgi:hypothetical protein